MMLKWQAIILNRIYETNVFDSIIIKSNTIDDINYFSPFQIYKDIAKNDDVKMNSIQIQPRQFIEAAHLLCKSKNIEQKREVILDFNRIVESIKIKNHQKKGCQFNVFHVILFSGLSKCTIWPNMFKTSRALIPSLIEFYNRFFNEYTQYLEYKFDPLILSSRFNRLVKQIKQKKLANPQLFEAVEKDHLPQLREIVIKCGQNTINQFIKKGYYIAHAAAMSSSIETMRFLLAHKVNFQSLDEEEQTPIFYAIKRFDLQIIKFMVEQVKININHKEYQNRTPIYLAAFQGKLDIVEYLHSKGGNPQIQSKLARTPLSKACYLGNVLVAEYLIKLGVKLESIDTKGRTALHNAAWGIEGGREGKRRGNIKLEDSPQCVQLLIKAGHKIDFEDNDKFTPLFSAISSCAQRSLRVLVKYGANFKHKTIKNETAVFIACKYGHLTILKILIQEYNCDILQQSIQGYTPLMAALTLDEADCLKYMLNVCMKKGIDFILNAKTFECLSQFQKQENLAYLQQWLTQYNQAFSYEDKAKFLSKAFEHDFAQILSSSFVQKDYKKASNVLKILKLLLNYLNKKNIEILIQRLKHFKFINDSVIEILLHEHTKGLTLPYIELNHSIAQEMMMKLLEIDTNLTQSHQQLYSTFLQLINLKLTKVIIFFVTCADKQRETNKQIYGIYKFKKQEILGIIYGKLNKKIGVLDYCLVNGHYEIHKLLCTFYNQNYEIADFQLQQRASIPRYQHLVLQLKKQVKSYLMPIKDVKKFFFFDHIADNYLNKDQLQIYKQVIKDSRKLEMNALLVKSASQFKQLVQHLSHRRLIGIDIQHYSSKSQSFICLIQIATIQKVFVIDRFNSINEQLTLFLKQIFADDSKIKIFHSYDNDLKWLIQDYSIEQFHSILDTARIYGLLTRQKNNTPSLKNLAEIYLNLQINKEYQRSDWRIRPLFKQMIDYAAADAKTLPFILLSMIQRNQILINGKEYNSEALKSMQTKKLLRVSGHKNEIRMI